MNKNLLFKTLVISILLSCFSRTNSQIVYKDIPDGVPGKIDFNGDGTPEFTIDTSQGGMWFYYYDQGKDNNVHAIGSHPAGGWDIPKCVGANFAVNSRCNWAGFGDCSVNGYGSGNPAIIFNTDQYLAVRFNLNGSTNIYYGWIRINVKSLSEMTYKDYAYNSTAGASILTGDKGNSSSIKETSNVEIGIYPRLVKDNIHIKLNQNLPFCCKIISSVGQTVIEKQTSEDINVSSLKRGIYFIQIQFRGSTQTFKFVKE